MGEIIQFSPKQTHLNRNRIEALSKGNIRTFECCECGEEFEVLFDKFPDECPHCHRRINWEESEVSE